MKATMDNTELNTAGDAILLQNVQDSRPENKIYHHCLFSDRAKWVEHLLSTLIFVKAFLALRARWRFKEENANDKNLEGACKGWWMDGKRSEFQELSKKSCKR